MKINLDSKEISKINDILKAKQYNIVAAELYIDYLENHYNDIKSIKTTYIDEFLDCLEIDKEDKEFKELDNVNKISDIKELDIDEYKNNPYYKNIKFLNHKEKDWQLANLYYSKYEGFVYDELEIDDKTYAEHTPIGYFIDKFIYPAVIQNDTIWMSVTPHEINTMKDSLNIIKDNVLVIGLGLGYYAYMASIKDEVKKITIIEKDKNVIELFNKFILPQFKNKDKIEIINIDAYKYFKNNKDLDYQYCFFDIYHNVQDGEELYLKMKSMENLHKNINYHYWIEDSILAMLRRQILTLFVEEYQGSKDIDYQKEENPNDRIINKLHFLLKEKEISSYEDLRILISNENLRKIAKDINYQSLF